jgi:hypothetical protein
LHIAIALRDKRAVEVLLAAGADPEATNAAGESAIQFAEKLKDGVRERPGVRPIADPSGEICELLANPPRTSLSALKEKYAPELWDGPAAISRFEEAEEVVRSEEKEAVVEREVVRPKGGRLQKILDEVEELSVRVGRLEATGTEKVPEDGE